MNNKTVYLYYVIVICCAVLLEKFFLFFNLVNNLTINHTIFTIKINNLCFIFILQNPPFFNCKRFWWWQSILLNAFAINKEKKCNLYLKYTLFSVQSVKNSFLFFCIHNYICIVLYNDSDPYSNFTYIFDVTNDS